MQLVVISQFLDMVRPPREPLLDEPPWLVFCFFNLVNYQIISLSLNVIQTLGKGLWDLRAVSTSPI